MSLTEAEIARIDALLEALGNQVEAGSLDIALRRLVPEIPLRHCDAADVLEEPFRQAGGVDLHLLDARSHCVAVTSEPDEATALLIADRGPL